MRTPDELAALARSATRTRHTSLGWGDAYAVAWSAIAEMDLLHPETPSGHLVAHGVTAIWNEHDREQRTHGATRDYPQRYSAPGFNRYWTRPPSSLEDEVVERVALEQIWPALSPAEQRDIAALAFEGERHENLDKARQTFRWFWHEGELPSRKWGYDHPGHAANFARSPQLGRAGG